MARRPDPLHRDAGFTLVEIVIALAILTIGLMALLSTFPVAFSAMHAARQSSTAVFLALQRLEEVKAFAASPDPLKGFDNVTAENFPAEPYAAITRYAPYRREVRIADAPPVPADTKVVRVTVFYHPTTDVGLGADETAVSLSTLIAWR